MLRVFIVIVHLIGAAFGIGFVVLGSFILDLVIDAIRNYRPGISIAAILFMAGLGALVLYLGILTSRGIYHSFLGELRNWRAERDGSSTELPRARVVR